MQKRIINPTYSYIPGGRASVSATFQLLADDGTTVLTEKGLSCQCELESNDFKSLIAATFAAQAQEHVDAFIMVAARVNQLFPTAPTFDAAVQQIADEALTLITVGGGN